MHVTGPSESRHGDDWEYVPEHQFIDYKSWENFKPCKHYNSSKRVLGPILFLLY